MARRKANVEEVKVVEPLIFTLTEHEYAEKGKAAGKLRGKLSEVEAKFSDIKKEWKGKVDEKQIELNNILEAMRAGKEERVVECTQRKNFDRNIVQYLYKGKVLKERPLEPHERQLAMKLTSGGKKKDGTSKSTKSKSGSSEAKVSSLEAARARKRKSN